MKSSSPKDPARTPPALTPREILAERARLLAQPIAANAAPRTTRDVVTFGLGDEHYAIETHYVQLVQRFADLTPLPNTSEHVLGLVSVRGELLVVFDLRVLLGVPRPQLGDLSRMLVLGEEQPEFAIVADSLDDVVELDEAELLELPAGTPAGSRAHLRGVTRAALLLFDGAALLRDPQLFVDEATTHGGGG